MLSHKTHSILAQMEVVDDIYQNIFLKTMEKWFIKTVLLH